MIIIIDYNMGNPGSILNMLKHLDKPAEISSDCDKILNAEKLILPGVGAFDNGMTNLKESGILEIVNEAVLVRKTPVLGICLGVQLFTEESEEGTLPGLGWISGKTKRFDFSRLSEKNLKIPHMGWNTVELKKESRLFKDMPENSRFYFVHSYHLCCDFEEDILALSQYGYPFTSCIEHGNIFGVQFHPEKSHRYGMKILQNFAEI
jgi:glutamine amidotransferase